MYTADELEAKLENTQRYAIALTVLFGLGWAALQVATRAAESDSFVAPLAADLTRRQTERHLGMLACEFGVYLGLFAIAALRWRALRLEDAIARANTLARLDGRSGQRVNVLGD